MVQQLSFDDLHWTTLALNCRSSTERERADHVVHSLHERTTYIHRMNGSDVFPFFLGLTV